jgi:dihydrofolate reductase
MITGHVFIATSLDGFVARKSGELDWLMKQETKGEDHGYDAFMASVDGLVMGRGSFQTVLTFGEWPYEKSVVVMSQTLSQDDVPEAIADRVTRLDPAGVMKMLDEKGWSRVYVDGGRVVQS